MFAPSSSAAPPWAMTVSMFSMLSFPGSPGPVGRTGAASVTGPAGFPSIASFSAMGVRLRRSPWTVWQRPMIRSWASTHWSVPGLFLWFFSFFALLLLWGQWWRWKRCPPSGQRITSRMGLLCSALGLGGGYRNLCTASASRRTTCYPGQPRAEGSERLNLARGGDCQVTCQHPGSLRIPTGRKFPSKELPSAAARAPRVALRRCYLVTLSAAGTGGHQILSTKALDIKTTSSKRLASA